MGAFKLNDPGWQRERKIESLKRRLMRKSHPRLHASIILSLTGLAGFLASFLLLRLGVSAMWLRYPVAILVAYCVFLLLLRLWLSLSRPRDWDLEVDIVETLDVVDSTEIIDSTDVRGAGFGGGGDFAGAGAGGSWGQSVTTVTSTKSVSTFTSAKSSGSTGFSFDFDLDDGWVLVVVIIALLVAASAALYIVYIAPVLLAEIMFDGVLMAALYKRVKTIEHRHWLRAALRRTWWLAILVAVIFAIAGFAMQKAAPEARSIGEFWQHVTDR